MAENDGSLNEQEALLIVNMRLYDVLMALYMEIRPDKAEDLMMMHQNGQLLGPLPSLNVEALDTDVDSLGE